MKIQVQFPGKAPYLSSRLSKIRLTEVSTADDECKSFAFLWYIFPFSFYPKKEETYSLYMMKEVYIYVYLLCIWFARQFAFKYCFAMLILTDVLIKREKIVFCVFPLQR